MRARVRLRDGHVTVAPEGYRVRLGALDFAGPWPQASRGTARGFGAVEPADPYAHGFWSLSPQTGEFCGMPIIPVGTADFGVNILDVPGNGPVWGWTPPGDMRAAEAYGRRLIADVEYRPAVPARPAAGWAGDEVEEAEALAATVGGVTSHGFVAPGLRKILGAFAVEGATAFPQVYDPDRSTDPRPFLRKCVQSYEKAGFEDIRPLLGMAAGIDYVMTWIDECDKLGRPWHIWTLQSAKKSGITCEQLGTAPGPQPQGAPAPFPDDRPDRPFPGGGGGLPWWVPLLLIGAAAFGPELADAFSPSRR